MLVILLTLTLLAMASIFALFVSIYYLIGPDRDLEERLGRSVPTRRQAQEPGQKREALADRLNERVGRTTMAQSIALDLARANLRISPIEYFVISGAIVLGAFIFGSVFSGNALAGVMLAIIGAMIPRLWIKRLQSRRQQMFNDQLPDVLALLGSSLRAGHGLLHAMNLVSQEMPSPSSEEFGRVVREIALGLPTREALAHLVERMSSDDLDLVVTAINVQNEVGGNLAQILDTITETIRERVRLKGEVNTMTTQGRMTGYMLGAMPFLLGTVIMLINPDYMMAIFVFPWIVIPAGALVSMIFGMLMIRKMLDLEY